MPDTPTPSVNGQVLSVPALQASMSILSFAPAARTLGWLASIATAGSFCLLAENGETGLPTVTRVSALNARALPPCTASTATTARTSRARTGFRIPPPFGRRRPGVRMAARTAPPSYPIRPPGVACALHDRLGPAPIIGISVEDSPAGFAVAQARVVALAAARAGAGAGWRWRGSGLDEGLLVVGEGGWLGFLGAPPGLRGRGGRLGRHRLRRPVPVAAVPVRRAVGILGRRDSGCGRGGGRDGLLGEVLPPLAVLVRSRGRSIAQGPGRGLLGHAPVVAGPRGLLSHAPAVA